MKKIFIVSSFVLLFAAGIFMYYLKNYDNKLVDANVVTTDSNYENITYEKEEKLENDLIGILKIEKIGLKATVKEGSNSKILKDYIGHIEGTSLYDGNICLAAHNRGNKYSYFARLNELKNGDIVKYTTNFYTREYKINSIKTIFETDLTILENTNENKITMITCIKNKRNQRLCVQAVQI
ncbi:MAG: class D sortase [Clostridia bacterium]|jgi:LPXTG-site transpeptidase (sortase) family protein|nr:sortase [Clostridium sp. CAG:571]HJJ06851.1 class D sortase [Clostridiaceae bacterium]HJJ13639.1 class D sortase [Clostridiaceae bacterium]